MKTLKVPTYGHHKPTGQARCYVNGKTVYLGKYGSEESRIRFGEIVAKVISGRPVDPFVTKSADPEAGLTINELVLAFMRHAETHYTKDGKPTSELSVLSLAWKPLVELYGFMAVDEFGPLALKAVRQKFVEAGWMRNSCNSGVNRIRRIFRWGVENEMVGPGTLFPGTLFGPGTLFKIVLINLICTIALSTGRSVVSIPEECSVNRNFWMI